MTPNNYLDNAPLEECEMQKFAKGFPTTILKIWREFYDEIIKNCSLNRGGWGSNSGMLRYQSRALLLNQRDLPLLYILYKLSLKGFIIEFSEINPGFQVTDEHRTFYSLFLPREITVSRYS